VSAPAPERVAVVGVGALGRVLVREFVAVGLGVRAFARDTSGLPDDVAALATDELAELARERFDALVVCVSDRAIGAVAERCAAAGVRAPVALHTSGCTPPNLLAPLAGTGAAVGFVHPLAAITAGTQRLDQVPFGLGGDAGAVEVGRALVARLGGVPVVVRPDRQARYHAAAALAAGGTVALAEAARALFESALDEPADALDAVRHLIASAAANLAEREPAAALTGPFVRGDAATIAAHGRALGAGDPAAERARVLAAALAPVLLDLARARGVASLDPDAIARVFDPPLTEPDADA